MNEAEEVSFSFLLAGAQRQKTFADDFRERLPNSRAVSPAIPVIELNAAATWSFS
jgi:hypothetical protein